ncbi:hypothetical protein [Streptomyces purpureus]|uniref:hypothetical protein n=1 Tax=Streptomyces purpureus TaxID=1951 RepID=UPI00036E4AC5|nr:hypothetical protein [Streptomyces purpureus]
MNADRRRSLWRAGEVWLCALGLVVCVGAFAWTMVTGRSGLYAPIPMVLAIALFELSYRCWDKWWTQSQCDQLATK